MVLTYIEVYPCYQASEKMMHPAEHLLGLIAIESINSRIKTIKIRSRGFRNKSRYENAIYFHLGGLNPYPDDVIR